MITPPHLGERNFGGRHQHTSGQKEKYQGRENHDHGPAKDSPPLDNASVTPPAD
jgi:hypothetical protein